MTTAVAVCALCGGGLHAARCPQCGHRTEPGWPTPAWARHAEPATGANAWGGVAIDVGLVLVIATAAWLVGQLLGLVPGIVVAMTIALTVASVISIIYLYCAQGQALGHRITNARGLVPASGLPPMHPRALPRVRFFTTARHDPLSTSSSTADAPDEGYRIGLSSLAIPLPTVVLPDGRRSPVGARTVIGRYPVPPELGATTLAINDLSRSMSRAHVALEADSAGQVVAIDLNSANGTALVVGTTTAQLKPQARVPVPLPCALRCGTQMITLIDAGAPAVAQPGPVAFPIGWLPS